MRKKRCKPEYGCRDGRCVTHHPGRLKFKGLWRTPAEVFERIRTDPSMRGVVWTEENGLRVGREGAFEIRLKIEPLD